jgi:hypothetical protein
LITRNRDFGEPPRAEKLQDLLLSRLLGHPTDLPALHHDEEPFDIFVDLAERDEDWRASLRSAVAKVLEMESRPDFGRQHFVSRGDAGTQLMGNLCYLAARIGSTEAIPMVGALAANRRGTAFVAPGEDLRPRALRSYVGLLSLVRNQPPVDYEDILTAALDEPRLIVIALTGLIGMSFRLPPNQAQEYVDSLRKRVPPNAPHLELLDVSIELAFPREF